MSTAASPKMGRRRQVKRKNNDPSSEGETTSSKSPIPTDVWEMEDVEGSKRLVTHVEAKKLMESVKEKEKEERRLKKALEKKKQKSLAKAAKSLIDESDGTSSETELQTPDDALLSSSDEDEGILQVTNKFNKEEDFPQKCSAKKRKVNDVQGKSQATEIEEEKMEEEEIVEIDHEIEETIEEGEEKEQAGGETPLTVKVAPNGSNQFTGTSPSQERMTSDNHISPRTETVTKGPGEQKKDGKHETGKHAAPKNVMVTDNMQTLHKAINPSDIYIIETAPDAQNEPWETISYKAKVNSQEHPDQGMKKLGPAGLKMNNMRGITSPLTNKKIVNTTTAHNPVNLNDAKKVIENRQAISIHGPIVPKRMMDELKRLKIVVAIENLKNWTQIRVAKIEDHATVFGLLDTLDIHGYTHSTEQSAQVTRILMDIDGETDPKEIEEEIRLNAGVEVVVEHMWVKNWYTPAVDGQQPLKKANKFKVTAQNKDEMKKVQNISIQYRAPEKVRWEAPQKNDVTQCYRCQRFNHTSKYCRMPFRCVKCNEPHGPGQCKNYKYVDGKIVKAYCANCSMHCHPANFRKCPHYIYAVETMKRRKAAQATLKNTKAIAFAESAARIVNPHTSFAQMAAMALQMTQPPPPIPQRTTQQPARVMAHQAPAPTSAEEPAEPAAQLPTDRPAHQSEQTPTELPARTAQNTNHAQASPPLKGSPLDATYGGVPICLLLSKIDPYIPLLNECKTEDERGEIMIKLFTSIKLDIYRQHV